MLKFKMLIFLFILQVSFCSVSYANNLVEYFDSSVSESDIAGMPMPTELYLKSILSDIAPFLHIAFIYLCIILVICLCIFLIYKILKKLKIFLSELKVLKHTYKLIDETPREQSNSNNIEVLNSKQVYNRMLDTFVGKLNYYFNIPAACFGPIWFFYRNAVGIGILFTILTLVLIALYIMSIAFGRELHYIFHIIFGLLSTFYFIISSQIYLLWAKLKIKKIIKNNPTASKEKLLSLSKNTPSLMKALIALIIEIILIFLIPIIIVFVIFLSRPISV